MRWRAAVALALAGAGACSDPADPAIVVEIQGRPSVHDVARLEVTVSNEGASQMSSFDTDGRDLPLTFSITAEGRTGAIDVAVRGLDAAEAEIAVGATSVDATADTASVMLDPNDFIVNTEFPGGQFLNQDAETNGFQVSVGGDVIAIGWRDDCPVTICNQFGRRFGIDAVPLDTELGAGPNQFRWNEVDGDFSAHVAVATHADGTTLAMWDTPTGVSCREMPESGAGAPGEVAIATETAADVVSTVPLADGSFAAVWVATVSTQRQIRTAVVTPSCGPRFAASSVGTPVTFVRRPTMAATPRGSLIAWIDGGEARFRTGTAAGVFTGASTGSVLVSVPSPDTVEFVRIVGVSDGYVVVYRRTVGTDDAIMLHRTDDQGSAMGTDTMLAQFPSDYGSPSLTVRPSDGAIGVAWQQCDDSDGAGCAVMARVVRPSGVPVGDAFVVNTTTRADQTDPSIGPLDDGFVVAYSDTSATAPDIDQSAVRARYIYPAFADARAVLGATCQLSSECGPNLACAVDADNDKVCHATCNPAAASPCPGGGSCTTVGSESFCVMGGN